MESICEQSVKQDMVHRRSLHVHHIPFKFVNYGERKRKERKCSCVQSSATARQLSSKQRTIANCKRQCHTYTNKNYACRFRQGSGIKRKTTPTLVDYSFNPPVKKLYLVDRLSSFIMSNLSVFDLLSSHVGFNQG